MCTHELWTYPECGCQITHQIACIDLDSHSHPNPSSPSQNETPSLDASRSHSRSPSSSRYALAYNGIQTHVDTSYTKFRVPRSTSPTTTPTYSESTEQDLRDRYHPHPRHAIITRNRGSAISPQDQDHGISKLNMSLRSCSVKHTLHKQFLEPICEDCLLDELGVKRHTGLPQIDCNDEQSLDGEVQNPWSAQESRLPIIVDTTEDIEDFSKGQRPTRRYAHGQHSHNQGLIWDSDVKVEITQSPPSVCESPIIAPVRVHGVTQDDIMIRADHFDMKRASAPSSTDLARRRPWLLQEPEAYLSDAKDKAVFESTVSVEVLDADAEADEAALTGALDYRLSSISVSSESHADEATSDHIPTQSAVTHAAQNHEFILVSESNQRFPLLQFPRTTSLALDTETGTLFDHAPLHHHHHRHPSTVSALTIPSASADADDESSLPSPHSSTDLNLVSSRPQTHQNTYSVKPNETTAILSPNVTFRQPKPRPRSTTKILRRRGMDISRASFVLRINSRWGSAERECLKGFKEDLLGRAKEVERKEDVKEGGAIKPGGVKEELKLSRGMPSDVLGILNKVDFHTAKQTATTKSQVDGVRGQADDHAALDAPIVKLHQNHVASTSEIAPTASKSNRGRDPKSEFKSEKESEDTEHRRSQSPAKTLLTRFTHVHHEGMTWAKDVFGGLKRSLSKDSLVKPRGSLRLRGKMRTGAMGEDCDDSRIEASGSTPRIVYMKGYESSLSGTIESQGDERGDSGGVRTLRAVVSVSSSTSASMPSADNAAEVESKPELCNARKTMELGSTCTFPAEGGDLYVHPILQLSSSSSTTNAADTWQSHLAHDLLMPRKAKKHVLATATSIKPSQSRTLSTIGHHINGRYGKINATSDLALNNDRYVSSNERPPSLSFSKHRFYELYNNTIEGSGGGGGGRGGDAESQKRLLLSSTSPSVPATRSFFSSASSVGSGNWRDLASASSSNNGSRSSAGLGSTSGSSSGYHRAGSGSCFSSNSYASRNDSRSGLGRGSRYGPTPTHWYRTGKEERLSEILKESDFDFDEGLGMGMGMGMGTGVEEEGRGKGGDEVGDGVGGVEYDYGTQFTQVGGSTSMVTGESHDRRHPSTDGDKATTNTVSISDGQDEHEHKHGHEQQPPQPLKTRPLAVVRGTLLYDTVPFIPPSDSPLCQHHIDEDSEHHRRPRNPTPSSLPTMRINPLHHPPARLSSPHSTKDEERSSRQ